MKKKPEIELTKGSEYRIYSISGREKMLESEGLFEGYITIGVEEIGLLLRLNEKHEDMNGKIRIIPLHAVLAMDVIEMKQSEDDEEDTEMPRYVG